LGRFCGLTVVFDLDGTIADTAPDLIDATNAALAAKGLPPAPPEDIKPGVGYGTRAMVRCALAALKVEATDEEVRWMRDRLVEHYEANIAHKTRLFPGFIEQAEALRSEGALFVCCTNKKERLATRLLSALAIAPAFAKIAGGDTYCVHKPDGRHILYAIRDAGGNRRPAIMVGDSEPDIAAAKDAGIPSIAVEFGYAAVPAEKLGADATLAHFDELQKRISTFLNLSGFGL
jgi:phosphoglycolate phosphatase